MFSAGTNGFPESGTGVANKSHHKKQKVEGEESPIINQRMCLFRKIGSQNNLGDQKKHRWEQKYSRGTAQEFEHIAFEFIRARWSQEVKKR